MLKLKDVGKKAIGCLCMVMVLGSFSGCENQNSANNEDVKLWWAYNTENFMQDIEYDLERDSTLRMAGIKGDVESIQLMITPQNDISGFKFEMNDIENENGNVISKDKFEILAEHYVEVSVSNEEDAYLGFYPDALVPLANYEFRRHNTIEAGQNQGIWLNVTIDENAEAGKYTGEGILTLDDEEYKVPVEVTVYDVTMPEEVHPQSSFDIWYEQIAKGEGDNADAEMSIAYFNDLVEHRVMPLSLPDEYEANYTKWLDYVVENMADNPKISSYGIPYKKTIQGTLNADDFEELINMMVEKNIELRKAGSDIDLFKKAFCYFGGICDEPTAERYPVVRDTDLIVSQTKIKLAKKLKDYPDIQESLLSLKHVVTTTYNETLVGTDKKGGVQTWCPLFDNFNSADFRNLMKERQQSTERAKSENVWWYGCINPTSPYASYHIDANLITSRALMWMQYDYGIEGNLYWCTCYYSGYQNSSYISRDVWTDPLSWENCNGEGQLTYPGKEYGVDGPISTLRFESIRESNEDYEYLWLFEQKVNEYNKQNGTELSANDLLQPYFTKLYKNVTPYTDTEQFSDTRIKLLETLEKIYKDINEVGNLEK